MRYAPPGLRSISHTAIDRPGAISQRALYGVPGVP